MNLRLTLGVAVVFFALAGVVYYLETNVPKPTGQPDQPEVFRFHAEDAMRVLVVGEGRSVEVVREKGRWQVVHPVDDAADVYAVESLVQRLGSLRATRALNVPAASLDEYGLLTPRASARLDLLTMETLVFHVGERTPDGFGTYLKREDQDTVYIVSGTIGDDLKRWLDRPPRAEPTATPAPAG